MVSFMRATLGFEADTMREASEQLADAEASALEDQRRAQRDPHAFRSALYPHGAEYALCHAMSQLMSAVVAVMSESLTEGIRGFYKLRKAYVTLDGIIDAEGRYVQENPRTAALAAGGAPNGSPRTATFPLSVGSKLAHEVHGDGTALGSAKSAPGATTLRRGDSDEEADDFQDAEETHDEAQLPSYLGHLEVNGSAKEADSPPSESHDVQYEHENLPEFSDPGSVQRIERLLSHDPSSSLFENPIDVFIHSGTNLCYGIVLTMLSLIPPAFGRLLSIIGFRGDRERGLRMLWQASKFANVMGAMAGLCLFGYYNAIVGSCDILPDPEEEAATGAPDAHGRETRVTGYPTHRLDALLATMRARFPASKLWLLEEARMHAVRQDLAGGLRMLAGDIQSPLKQVHALAVFERSLQALFAHEHALCSASFQECITLNNWSPALYLFIAGAAELELYRRALDASKSKKKPSKDAERHAAKATELLQSARAVAGKKKFMARQLPFDTYVLHCLNKWEARAKALHVAFADAVGTAPLEVMIFMWAGHKKMAPAQLEASLHALDHRPPAASADVAAAVVDTPEERAMRAVLRAACLRSLGRPAEAKDELHARVLAPEARAALGHAAGRDDWPAPAAHYEMAASLWAERRAVDDLKAQRARVNEAEDWLQRAAKWERYMLDARVGVRVTTGLDTVRRWRAEHDPAVA